MAGWLLTGALVCSGAELSSSRPDPAAPSWLDRGEIELRRGSIDRAGEYFERAAEENPVSARAWLGLARVAEARFAPETALKHWRRAAELSSGPAAPLPRRRLSVPVTYDMPESERQADVWRLLTPVESACLRLERLSNGGNLHGFGVEISLNGHKPLRVLLDTGATGLLLARDLLPPAGVEATGVNLLRGVGDQSSIRAVRLHRVESLRMGSIEYANAVVQAADRDLLVGFDGIMGADVFAHFLVTLDFPARRLLLESREATREEGFEPVYRQGHALLVPARVNRQDGVLLQIDSGANRSLLDESLARRAARLSDDPFQQVRGASGAASRVWRVEHAEFEMAGRRCYPRNVLAISFARQNQVRPFEVHGILGLPELQHTRLSIDYSRGLIKFGK